MDIKIQSGDFFQTQGSMKPNQQGDQIEIRIPDVKNLLILKQLISEAIQRSDKIGMNRGKNANPAEIIDIMTITHPACRLTVTCCENVDIIEETRLRNSVGGAN
jgi:hypothetical protein